MADWNRFSKKFFLENLYKTLESKVMCPPPPPPPPSTNRVKLQATTRNRPKFQSTHCPFIIRS